MRKFIKKFKNSIIGKILKIIWKVLWWTIEALIVFLAIIIITQRIYNDQKAFLGFRIYNVATGSMEPEYAVGDILISKEIDPSKIKVGDNIVYLGNEAGYSGKIITHSVIQIEQNEKGEYLFHTKGRANTIEDPIVHEDQVYGTVVQNNIALAWLCRILTNRYGLYFFVIVPIVLWFFIEFVKSQTERIDQEIEAERERKTLHEEKRKQNTEQVIQEKTTKTKGKQENKQKPKTEEKKRKE